MRCHVFPKHCFVIESLATGLTPESVLPSMCWQMILEPYFISENLIAMFTLISDTLVTLHVFSIMTFVDKPSSTVVTVKTEISSVKLHVVPQISSVSKGLIALSADELFFSFLGYLSRERLPGACNNGKSAISETQRTNEKTQELVVSNQHNRAQPTRRDFLTM